MWKAPVAHDGYGPIAKRLLGCAVRVGAQTLEQEPLDPWGQPYQFRLEQDDAGHAQPVVRSLGEAGDGTGDVLVSPSPPVAR